MRQVKWVGVAFFLGSLIILNPSHSPAQFKKGGRKGGFGADGGFGKGGFGGGGFNGGGFNGNGFGGRNSGFGGRNGGFGGGPAPVAYGAPTPAAPTVYGVSGPSTGGMSGGPSGFAATPAPYGTPGGFGAAPAYGGPNAFGAAPGGFGGGPNNFRGGMGGGGGPRGFGSDPAAMWDRISQGQSSINVNDPQRAWLRTMMERRNIAIPADGVVTREMYISAVNAAGGAGGPTPGGPMAMTINPQGSGFSGPGGPMRDFGGGPGGRGNDRERGDRFRQQDGENGGRDRYNNGPMGDGYGSNSTGNYGDQRNSTEEARPVAIRYGHLPKDLPEWFDADDANKDGQVALHEWRKAGKDIKEFYTYDLDGDGLITADEYLRYGSLKAEEARIAAINDPENAGMRPPVALRRGPTGGFSLPGSTPASFDVPQDRKGGPGDRTRGNNSKNGNTSERPKGKRDRSASNDDDPAPAGGNGGKNPFRKGKN